MAESQDTARLERMDRALRFIEANLENPITLADIAASVYYSLFHFCRVFNQTTRHSPYDYLMRRRLSQAAGQLVESSRKIIDIALELQFNSPESFSRAFKKMFGMQPSQIRRRAVVDRRFLLEPLSPRHLQLISRMASPVPERVTLKSVRICGLMSRVEEDFTVVLRLWEDLRNTEAGRAPDGREAFAVVSLPTPWTRSGYYYLAGFRGDTAAHPAAARRTVAGGEYARFIFRALPSELPLILQYILQTWLPKRQSGGEAACLVVSYGNGQLPTDGEALQQEVYLPLA